jgi:hypothetical protein
MRERDEAVRRCEQWSEEHAEGAGGVNMPARGSSDAVLEAAERDQLAAALDRLVRREGGCR